MDNVLVFPCGTEIGLEIARGFYGVKGVELLGANSVRDYGDVAYKKVLGRLPYYSEPDFIERLAGMIDEFSIDYFFPAHDGVLSAASSNRERLNCRLVAPRDEICSIARNKRRTYGRLGRRVRVPRLYAIEELSDADFPVFVKPEVGQGAVGAQWIGDYQQLAAYQSQHAGSTTLIMEWLPGEEYTVDCYSEAGCLRYCGVRQRRRIRSGISVSTGSVDDLSGEFQEFASALSEELSMDGVWFFQARRARDQQLVLLEFAPRIAGSMGLYRLRGINFPELAYLHAKGAALQVIDNQFPVEMERALDVRYRHAVEYDVVYVDFDDCLVIGGQVNDRLVGFLYRSMTQGKRLVLLTRHRGNIEQALSTHRLSALFDEVIHLQSDESKADYIRSDRAIFIDDSFAERRSVRDKTGIPVFSVDAAAHL